MAFMASMVLHKATTLFLQQKQRNAATNDYHFLSLRKRHFYFRSLLMEEPGKFFKSRYNTYFVSGTESFPCKLRTVVTLLLNSEAIDIPCSSKLVARSICSSVKLVPGCPRKMLSILTAHPFSFGISKRMMMMDFFKKGLLDLSHLLSAQ